MDNNIKWIVINRDIYIPGYGMLKEGDVFQVVKANKRFIYVDAGYRVSIRLARKKDCTVVF